MLIQFNFSNFKSFKDKAILDLSATKETEFSGHKISIAREKILPVALIYGANASGKTNVFDAFRYMSQYVLESFGYGGETENTETNPPIPFLLDLDSKNKESSFEVYFTVPGDETEKVYNYGFCVDQEGVKEEWLNYRSKTGRKYNCVFYRETDAGKLDLSGLPENIKNSITVSLEKQSLIVSLGAKLKVDACKTVRDWFLASQTIDFADWMISYHISNRFPRKLVEDTESHKKLIDFFASFGENIEGFEIKDTRSDGTHFEVNTKRKMIDSQDIREISLKDESAGTQKMLALYPILQAVLERGSVLFIDELDARLHPLLTRNIILTFLNPELNPKHAQLIFTVQDAWQLSNQLLRRDEIWFVEKNTGGVSDLYSLADFINDDGNKIRKDESYEKNYVLGKYGAIPTLKYIDISKEE